jgi:non-specific serine/threonine protein kinase
MDGTLLVSGGQDGTIKLWEAAPASGSPGRLLATLQGHTGGVEDVALSTDGTLLASGGLDGTVKLWAVVPASGTAPHPEGTGYRIPAGRLLATLQGHSSGAWGVALSGDGRLVASGSQDGAVRLWETESGRLLATLRGHTGLLWSVALSGDGLLAASGSQDGTIKLWEAAPASGSPGRLLATLQGHTGGVKGVALSADGHIAASGGYDGTIKLWEARSGSFLRILRRDRRYERLDISGLTGVSAAQRMALLLLGAVEQEAAHATQITPARESHPLPTAPAMVSAPVSMPAQPPDGANAHTRSLTNLPPARTTFVGRAGDVASLTQALDPTTRTGARLLTLSGMAGCGKTRLALAVADAVLDAYNDGVWLVELAPLPSSAVADLTMVVAATLAVLGLHEQPGKAPVDTLIAHLQPRRLLLVLDNCEHVVAACALLATRLLGGCADLQILTTSQQPLGTEDETVWPVTTLAAPSLLEGAATPEVLNLLRKSEAVQLFVERAQAVLPEFDLSPATAAGVVAICRRLDGLPLAIELAAARLNVLPVAEILTRLDDRFRLLRRGGRMTVDRHQTLQATMDWSYGLLDLAEQAVLRRLAVFAGGWEVVAAEAVIGDGEGVTAETVLDVLDELLDRSLVYVQQGHGTPRYGMLETVRQYGLQQLERVGETAAVRVRHLRWCAMLAEQAAPALQGPEQALWLGRLDREHDNLRAAMQWALERGLSSLGLRVAAGLWQFWRSRSHLSEGRRWLAALLALAADDDDATSMALRATALEGAAWLTEDEHDFTQANTLFAQSSALRRALGLDEPQTGLLINAAMEARAGGNYARATTLLKESLARHRALGNRDSIKRGGLGLSLSRLALVLGEQGEYAGATALYEECLALHRGLEDWEGIGNALLGLGDVARDQGDTARVHVYCEETLTLFRDLGHTWVGFSLNNLAQATYLEGDLELAVTRAEESAALFRDLQAGPSLAEVLITLGRIRGAQSELVAAQAHLAEALMLAWEKGPRFVVAAGLEELGVQAVREGQAPHGVHLLGGAARLRQGMGAPVRPADRSALEGALAVARASLGATAFTDAWATGQTLPLEQIVARALAGPEDIGVKAL